MTSPTIEHRAYGPGAIDARKRLILGLAQDAVERRGQRRRARRHAVVMLLLTAGATILAVTLMPSRMAPAPSLPIAEAPPARAPSITRVATTTGLADALAAHGTIAVTRIAPDASRIARVDTRANPAQRLTDLEALALLREAGTPAGLIRMEGRVTLVYHDAQDAPPGPSGRAPSPPAGQRLAWLPYRVP